MADVFISYDRVEHDAAARIVQKLRQLNVDVWFDARVRPEEVKKSKVVLVCWTQAAVASEWVRGEALLAHREGKLLGCLLEVVALSPPFNAGRVENLSKWSGQDDDTAWQRLLARIGERIGRPGLESEVPVRPPPAPRAQEPRAETPRAPAPDRHTPASRDPDAGRAEPARGADVGRNASAGRDADAERNNDRDRGGRGSAKKSGGEAWKLLLGDTDGEPPPPDPEPAPRAPVAGGQSAWDRLLGEPRASNTRAPSAPETTVRAPSAREPREEPRADEPSARAPSAKDQREQSSREPNAPAPKAPGASAKEARRPREEEPRAGKGRVEEPIISEPIVRGPSEGAPRDDDDFEEDDEPFLDIDERVGAAAERTEERLRSAGELRFSRAADKLGKDWFTGGSDDLATFETPDRASGKWTKGSGGGPKKSHLIAGIVVVMGVLVFAGAYFATDYFANTPPAEFANAEPSARAAAPAQQEKASAEAPSARAKPVRAGASAAAVAPAPESGPQVSDEERRAWRSARAGGTRAQYQAYLTSFPNGAYADEAQSRLDALQPQAPSAQQPNTVVALMRDEMQRLGLRVDGSDAALGPLGARSVRQLQAATKMRVDGRPSRALLRRVAVLQSCHMERSLRDHVFRAPVRGVGEGASPSECCSAASLNARNNVQSAGLGYANPWSNACNNLSRLPPRRLAGPPEGEASDRGTYASCETQDDPANPGAYSCAVTGEIACGYQARSGADALVCE